MNEILFMVLVCFDCLASAYIGYRIGKAYGEEDE